MRALGLALLAMCLMWNAAYAGDCGSCASKPACGHDKCGQHQRCDQPCERNACDTCNPCEPACPCEPCKAQRVREGCIPVPLPEDGCGRIDPECCPRQDYRLVCVERAEFRLLCQKKCCKPKHACKTCEKDCTPRIEMHDDMD